jgi:FkbH-like protein
MKLIDALRVVKAMRLREGSVLRSGLAAGFNPLHLKTFLTAELSEAFTVYRIEIVDGLYGDLLGNIARLASGGFDYGFVLIEWSDLDSRLGLRNTARWSDNEVADILATAKTLALQIREALDRAGQHLTLAVSLPTLPLLPVACTPRWQAGSFQCDLRSIAQTLASAISVHPQIRILNSEWLDLESPLGERHDHESELLSGFPYRLPHASVLASALRRTVESRSPKKGLITDLDETLWKGILGEDGVDGISWSLEHHSQIHAFYQRFLGALASEGVLIAAASRNDPALVEQALRRSDLAINPDRIFPVEANWKEKSRSAKRILRAWNIGPDAVVFVDDNPRELAEVKAAFPTIDCVQFPAGNTAAVYETILRLRDMFGKGAVIEEDAIRLDSIRRSHLEAHSDSNATGGLTPEQIDAEIVCDFTQSFADARSRELVNKTNQFNLNGKRYSDSEWRHILSDPRSFLLTASYRDKFGPLGKIAVLTGSTEGRTLTIRTWAMSCRAFARRIEYRCLAELLDRFDPAEVVFEYAKTARNAPIQDFLTEIVGEFPASTFTVLRNRLRLPNFPVATPQEVVHG